MKISKFAGFFNALGILVLLHPTSALALPPNYDALIQTTKGNLTAAQLAPALEQLRAWRQANPEELRIVYDLAALLDKAGNYPEAESYYSQIIQTNLPTNSPTNAPAYAINAVAHAALKNQHFQPAKSAYQLLISKTPNDIHAHVGLVYAWMGQQRTQHAFDYIVQHLPQSEEQYSAKDLPMLVALAELHEQRKAWLEAASVCQKILQLDPQSQYIKRKLVFALKEAGMPYLAKYYADQYPSEFNDDEKYQIAQAADATIIRFGEAQLLYDTKPSRFNTNNIALAENTELTKRFGAQTKTKFDRIVALRDRGNMQEAVQLYRSLLPDVNETNLIIPTYVKFAAADAYLFLEQPEMARDLYLDGLNNFGDNDSNTLLDIQTSLAYAYSEAGQYREAEALTDKMITDQPPMLYKGIPSLEQANPDYLRACIIKIRFLINHNRLALAEKQLRILRAQAPFNTDIQSTWGYLQNARAHPRAALDQYSIMLLDHPTLVEAKVGRADTLLSLNEFAQAKIAMPALLDENPENKSVHMYAERLENYGQPFYKIESIFGRGSVTNGADSLVSAFIYSAPLTNLINDRVRLFSHLEYASGETIADQTATRSRLGIGMDYRSRDWEAEAEVHRTLDAPHLNGVALTVGWNISDAWNAQAAIDTNTINLPAEALINDISAKEAKLNLTWSQNESRQIGGELSSTRFSDSNVRDMGSVHWRQGWITHPVFKFGTDLYLGTSRNSAIDRPYFNPSRDKDVNVEFDAEWLTWQRYRRSFTQRVKLDVGHYWQNDFGSGQTAGLRYEHRWTLENETEITYGVGRSFQPFDGVREHRKYAYLNLSGRIK